MVRRPGERTCRVVAAVVEGAVRGSRRGAVGGADVVSLRGSRGAQRVCAARLPGLHWAAVPPPTRTGCPTTPVGPAAPATAAPEEIRARCARHPAYRGAWPACLPRYLPGHVTGPLPPGGPGTAEAQADGYGGKGRQPYDHAAGAGHSEGAPRCRPRLESTRRPPPTLPTFASTTTTTSTSTDDGGIWKRRGSDTVAAQRRKRDRSTPRTGWPALEASGRKEAREEARRGKSEISMRRGLEKKEEKEEAGRSRAKAGCGETVGQLDVRGTVRRGGTRRSFIIRGEERPVRAPPPLPFAGSVVVEEGTRWRW
ncbi:hypothetical protein KM043_001999 [Ampulex compressa]|nr:hypothetical protein KM043_001999 [Ampulex compressa]